MPLDERNDWSSPGARASLRMNLHEADMAPELELNEILWQSMHGAGARMPPPRRTGFIRPIDDGDDDVAEKRGDRDDPDETREREARRDRDEPHERRDR